MTKTKRGRVKDSLQYDFFGELYAGDAKRVGKYGFPQLKQASILPDGKIRSFNYLLSLNNPENYWVHCFVDDYQFERMWKGFYRYLPYIKNVKGFITTDYSLYRDYDYDWLIWNCYRNRIMAYAIQQEKEEIIPSAGFGPENTWGWCFDGIAYESAVAITTNGVLGDKEARRLFAGGMEALVHTVNPPTIVVCGKYPEWLPTKYPDIQFIGIPSYSQQWHERRKA